MGSHCKPSDKGLLATAASVPLSGRVPRLPRVGSECRVWARVGEAWKVIPGTSPGQCPGKAWGRPESRSCHLSTFSVPATSGQLDPAVVTSETGDHTSTQ